MKYKHLIGIPLLLLLTACGPHRQADALLSQADSLMVSRPDSAYTLLTAITSDERSDWRKADRMWYEMTLAEAMNKAYLNKVFPWVEKETLVQHMNVEYWRYDSEQWKKLLNHHKFLGIKK